MRRYRSYTGAKKTKAVDFSIDFNAIRRREPPSAWIAEGRYLDWWSLFHVLIPFGAAWWLGRAGLPRPASFYLISMGVLGYEAIENKTFPSVHEAGENQVIDLALGNAGALVGAII